MSRRIVITPFAAEQTHPEIGTFMMFDAGTVVSLLAEFGDAVVFSADLNSDYPHSAWFNVSRAIFETRTVNTESTDTGQAGINERWDGTRLPSASRQR